MKVIDLTLRISPSLRVFPGSPQPAFVPWTKFATHTYESEAMFMSTHTGTHMDAPSHFAPGMPSIDRIPAGRFVSSALLISVRRKAGQLIEKDDVESEEIKEGDAIVFATGWEKRVRERNYMTENPGIAADAARFLARKRVNIVGIDGPSIDAGSDGKFTTHNILLPRNILAVENLCNLGKIARKRFMLVVSPLKLQGATGSPVRALAIV